MKVFKYVFLTLVICLFAASCQKKVNIDVCLSNADTLVKTASEQSEFYLFESSYDSSVEVYIVLMRVDESKIDSIINNTDVKSEYKQALRTLTLEKHNTNTSAINAEINNLKAKKLEDVFAGTDVLVEYGYVSLDKTVTWY